MHIININLHNYKKIKKFKIKISRQKILLDMFYARAKFHKFSSLRGRDLRGGGQKGPPPRAMQFQNSPGY